MVKQRSRVNLFRGSEIFWRCPRFGSVDHETAYQPRRQYRLQLTSSAETTQSPHHARRRETTRLFYDYCISIFIGLPVSSHTTSASVSDGSTCSAFAGLHRLPIPYRIQYIDALTKSWYLGNIVTAPHNNPSRQRLHPSTGTDYLIPRTRTKLSERSFSVASPTFKRVLKSHFVISVLILRHFLWHCNASSVQLVVDHKLNR